MNRVRTVALGVVATFATGFVLAAAAEAHVTVDAPGATKGAERQDITFRVPVEKDVNTTGLTVQLPASTPFAFALVEPVPGWTHTEKTTKLATPIETDDGNITSAVSQITWKATDGGLEPGEYGRFTILAGPMPDKDSITFKALQTYADGSVVRWIQTAAPGSSAEPDFPAPNLQLADASDGAMPLSQRQTGDAGQADPTSASSSDSGSSNTGPVVLSIIALVLAAAALGLAVVSRARRRSDT